MTISELGSIGELIAAIATIFTLLYLAIQIRVSRNTAVADTERQIMRDWTGHLSSLYGTSDSTRVVITGLKEGLSSLSKNEAMMFSARLSELVQYYWSAKLMVRKGLINEEISNYMRTTIAMVLQTKGGREWWVLTSFSWPTDIDNDISTHEAQSFSEWHDSLTARCATDT